MTGQAPLRAATATGTAPVEAESRTAVEKACGLLAAFRHDPDGIVGVSELARRSGLSKSTPFRQLTILERAAMVERVGRGYRIGRSLKALARGALEHQHATLGAELMPYLTEAFEHTRQTVQLGVLDGADIVFLATIRGHHTLATPNNLHLRLPASTTAAGKLLLTHRGATLPPAGGAQPFNKADPASHRSVLRPAGIPQVLRDTVAFDLGDTDKAVWCVAAPVLASHGQPVASLSICAHSGTPLSAAANILVHISRVASRQLQSARTRIR